MSIFKSCTRATWCHEDLEILDSGSVDSTIGFLDPVRRSCTPAQATWNV